MAKGGRRGERGKGEKGERENDNLVQAENVLVIQ
jgi:hypothetical protein